MGFGAGTHWAFDTGGTNLYGGGFDTGNANMPTDLATSNGTDAAPVVTSASYTFVASDVGHWLFIKSGTNSIPGWYQVASVVASPNSATLTAGVGAAVKFPTTSPIAPNTAQGIGTASLDTFGGLLTRGAFAFHGIHASVQAPQHVRNGVDFLRFEALGK